MGMAAVSAPGLPIRMVVSEKVGEAARENKKDIKKIDRRLISGTWDVLRD
jgi:hypothetical protein